MRRKLRFVAGGRSRCARRPPRTRSFPDSLHSQALSLGARGTRKRRKRRLDAKPRTVDDVPPCAPMDLLELSFHCTDCNKKFTSRQDINEAFSVTCPICKRNIVTAICYRGFVYILSNPAMPGLVKIGLTERDPYERAFELDVATGVPTPFYVEAFFVSDDPRRDEAAIHILLDVHRVSSNREFFRLEVQQAIDALTEALRRRPAVINDGSNPQLRVDFDDCYLDQKQNVQTQTPPSSNSLASNGDGPASIPFPTQAQTQKSSAPLSKEAIESMRASFFRYYRPSPQPPTPPSIKFQCVVCQKQFLNEPPPPNRCPSCDGAICSI